MGSEMCIRDRDSYQQVLADVQARDARDASRAEAPMIAAQDAVILDTSDLSIEDAVAEAIAMINRSRSSAL